MAGASEAEMPDDAKQDELIEISETDPNLFKTLVIKIINDNRNEFNILELNKNNDETDTKMTKESFVSQFNNTFKTQLLNIIFDIIDESCTGSVTNAALIAFLSNKSKHPTREPTTIDPKWLFKTIKKMNFGQLDANNDRQVSLDEMKNYFTEIKDQNVSDEIVKIVFNEIDSNHKGYISMKDFFQWRDKFNANKLRTWSHTLSETVIMTGLEDLIHEINSEETSDDSKIEMEMEMEIESENNINDLLQDILSVLDLGQDDTHTVELTRVIKESVQKLQYQLAEARLQGLHNANTSANTFKQLEDTEQDRKLMKTEVNKHKAATKKLSKELTELIGRHVSTDNPNDLLYVIRELQSKLSDERLDGIKQENMNQQLRDEIARLEYRLGDAKYAMTKLKKELSETLGQGLQASLDAKGDDPIKIHELFQKLQYQLAEERMDKIKTRRESMQLNDKIEKINYQLADERLQLIQLRDSIQEIIDFDINSIDDDDDENAMDRQQIKQLFIRLKSKVNDEQEQTTIIINNNNNDDDDDNNNHIQTIDMEKELAKMAQDDEIKTDDNYVNYNKINDINKLKQIIKALKSELRNSRTNHLAVSETKTHLEVQTFDLQTKLNSEKKKYTKLLRMSQQMAGFDPQILQVDPEQQQQEEQEEEVQSDTTTTSDDTTSDNEKWNGTAQELDDEIKRLQNQLTQSKDQIVSVTAENEQLSQRIEKLQANNRNHRRRESEVFTAIGDDAKNVIQQFEELEENRKKMENDALQLAYLQAEQRRMQIAYEHAKANASKYRLEATNLKSKLKESNESNESKDKHQVTKMKDKLSELERKVKENENNELELAFYKAEKQRMDIKFEFQENKAKQVRELNKELQKAVKQEKEKVRRMSQQFTPNDMNKINQQQQQQPLKTNPLQLKEQVNKLKDQLTIEQQENALLQQRLSNAENTQVNKLLSYVNQNNIIIPPPPNNQINDEEEEEEEEDNEDNEDNDSNASPLSTGNEGDDEMDKNENEMESLKFKLANAELQNAQLKRRVSIAGIEKEQLSLLWESPRVTIQMVSEFIERLPLKHKEKIWARHATGQYIAKNKILHTLHSFVALCIKIKDRTAVAPSRHDIEKRLVPFADVIRQRTENANGMSLDEFNNELHFWILEPVSGLVMTSDEQKQWMEEIDQLREELVKAQKEKLRIQRKSQMDLTVLLDKMKEFEQEPSDKISEMDEQISELQNIVDELQDDIKEKEEEINQLNEENFNLRQGRDKARESEDDEEEQEQEQEPVLIDESQHKTISEFRDLQMSSQFEEERLEYSRNDNNITKSQQYIGWKNKAETAKQEITRLERERKQSVEQVTRLRETVEELRSSKKQETSEYKSQAQQFKLEIAKFKKKYQESDRIRKDSISTLHDNLFAKLLEAEAEHEEMVADYKQQIGTLQKTNKAFEMNMNAMAQTKLNTISSLANTVQELRESVTVLSKQIQILQNKNHKLESRTTVQHITSSFSGWLG